MKRLRHFLEVDDLRADELIAVLDAADAQPVPVLRGLGVGLVFEKPSLRTRNSCEMAVVQLGGHPVTIKNDEIVLDARETVEDVTRVLAGYYAVLGARVFAHNFVERMAAVSTVPVVNLLSDTAHPCQALADLLTIRRHFGGLRDLQLGWVGDFNNVARSLTLGAAMAGIHVRISSPHGYGPGDVDIERRLAVAPAGVTIEAVPRPLDAVKGADIVVTDSWVSMGQEADRSARVRSFEGFTVDEELFGSAAAGAVFLHCLPAHRGEEVSAEVIDGPQSLVIPEAHNRLHAFRGLLLWLFDR